MHQSCNYNNIAQQVWHLTNYTIYNQITLENYTPKDFERLSNDSKLMSFISYSWKLINLWKRGILLQLGYMPDPILMDQLN